MSEYEFLTTPAPKNETNENFVVNMFKEDVQSPPFKPRLVKRVNTPIMVPMDDEPFYSCLSDIDENSDNDCEIVVDFKRPELKRNAAITAEELQDAINLEMSDNDEVQRPKKKQGSHVTRYCFTYNNPVISGEDMAKFLKDDLGHIIKGFVFQTEKGESGTEHFQGYMELSKRMYTAGLQKELGKYKMTLLHAKGTKPHNFKYCTKEEGRVDGPWYYGTCHKDQVKGQGKRTDLDEFARLCSKEGGVTESVRDEFWGHAMRYKKHVKEMVNDDVRKKAEEEDMAYWAEQAALEDAGVAIQGQVPRTLTLYFGPSAVGKTTKVQIDVKGRLKQRLYKMDCRKSWWDNYEYEEHILMDEFKGGSEWPLEKFNYVTNNGPCQVEVKGGATTLIATHMYFTSNRHPSQWWEKKGADGVGFSTWNDPRYQAVARRFQKICWWNDAKELTILENPGPSDQSAEWETKQANWLSFWKWKDTSVTFGEEGRDDPGYFSL